MQEEHIGVCVIVLNQGKTKLLLGKRLNCYKPNTYGLPGGRLNLKESLLNCARRELIEETGLVAKNLKYIGVVRDLQKRYNFIHFVFICSDFEGKPKNIEPYKCEKWQWFSFGKLPQNILPGHNSAIEIYLNPNKQSLMDIL